MRERCEAEAREIIKSYEGEEDYMFLLERITSALTSAEKKGLEETWRETKWVKVIWNEAIESAAKVAENHICKHVYEVGYIPKEIAEQINKLKKA